MMHNEIEIAHNDAKFEQISDSRIYVADFTERTKHCAIKRSVEVSNYIQPSPDGKGVMDSVTFHNPNKELVEFAIFKDSEYLNKEGNNIRHCECAMYVGNCDNLDWIAFLEIKDCKVDKVCDYIQDAKEQIENVVRDFKDRNLINQEKLFGIYSCPQKKTNFNDFIFGDPITASNYKRTTGINLLGTNNVLIISRKVLSPQINH